MTRVLIVDIDEHKENAGKPESDAAPYWLLDSPRQMGVNLDDLPLASFPDGSGLAVVFIKLPK